MYSTCVCEYSRRVYVHPHIYGTVIYMYIYISHKCIYNIHAPTPLQVWYCNMMYKFMYIYVIIFI